MLYWNENPLSLASLHILAQVPIKESKEKKKANLVKPDVFSN